MIDDTFTVMVEADPNSSGEVMPRCFRLGTRVIEVVEIFDRWPGADYLYVKLLGSDGVTYILRQDLARGRWQLILFHNQCSTN